MLGDKLFHGLTLLVAKEVEIALEAPAYFLLITRAHSPSPDAELRLLVPIFCIVRRLNRIIALRVQYAVLQAAEALVDNQDLGDQSVLKGLLGIPLALPRKIAERQAHLIITAR